MDDRREKSFKGCQRSQVQKLGEKYSESVYREKVEHEEARRRISEERPTRGELEEESLSLGEQADKGGDEARNPQVIYKEVPHTEEGCTNTSKTRS